MTTPAPPTPAAPAPAAPAAPEPTAPPAPAPASAGPAPAAPAPVAPAPAWTPPPAIPAPPPTAPADDGSRDVSRLPQWAQKEIGDLRKENADRRVTARTAVVNQHAFVAAPTLGVNGHALLNSIPFQQAAAELDPAAPEFNTQLAAKIQEILAANPWMATASAAPAAPPPPAASGGEFTGAPGEGQPITEEQLSRMTPEQIAQAYTAGKLSHLM